jgi:hypothetical protein
MRCPLLITVLLGAFLVSCSEPQGDASVFRGYLDALNRHAVSEALAFHTSDAEFALPGQTPIRGTEGLRSLLQWDSVLQSTVRFAEAVQIADTLILGPGSERNLWFQGIGLDSVAYAGGTRVVLQGTRIHGIYPAPFQRESATEFEGRYTEFMTWAEREAPEEVARLLPGGLFRYDMQSAEAWLELLREYYERHPHGHD